MTVDIHDNVACCAMRLCAARLDPSVTGDQYIAMLADYARSVIAEYAEYAATTTEPAEPSADGAAMTPSDPEPKSQAGEGGERCDSDAEGAAELPEPGHRARKVLRLMTYADQQRIKREILATRAESGRMTPRGFFAEIAERYGYSTYQVQRVANGQDPNR